MSPKIGRICATACDYHPYPFQPLKSVIIKPMSKTPFPGMDPYLEHPSLWPDVHNRLIASLADAISPTVAPNYYVGVESRAYVIKPEGDKYLGYTPSIYMCLFQISLFPCNKRIKNPLLTSIKSSMIYTAVRALISVLTIRNHLFPLSPKNKTSGPTIY